MNRFIWLVALLIVLVACSSPTPALSQPTPIVTKPQVVITAPPSGRQYPTGADVAIQSTSSDTQGVSRVELLVDGQSVRSDPIPTGKSQPQFQVVQTWKATTPGAHTVIVRATNESGATGEAALSLTVTEPPKPPPTRTPIVTLPTPFTAPTISSTPIPTKAAAPTSAPTVMQYTYTVNEQQFNDIANGALSPSVVMYADSASVKLQDGQVTISANFYPPNIKPSTGRVVLIASANNCKLSISVVSTTFGYTSLPGTQQAALGQSIERMLTYQLAQQRQSTCVDSVSVVGGVMTIKYH